MGCLVEKKTYEIFINLPTSSPRTLPLRSRLARPLQPSPWPGTVLPGCRPWPGHRRPLLLLRRRRRHGIEAVLRGRRGCCCWRQSSRTERRVCVPVCGKRREERERRERGERAERDNAWRPRPRAASSVAALLSHL